MNSITEVVAELESRFGCKLVGEIQAFDSKCENGEDGSDIDLFAREYDLRLIAEYLESNNFVLGKRTGGRGFYAKKIFDDNLYHLDIASMPLLLHRFPDIQIKNKFFADIWKDRNLEKFFRYVLQFRNHRQKYTDFVGSNFDTYSQYLSDKTYFNEPVFKKGVTADDVVGVMDKKLTSFLRAFTLRRLIKLFFAYILLQITKILSRKGEIIAFVGADGAGKTTIITKMSMSIGTHVIYVGDSQFFFQSVYDRLLEMPKPIPYIVYIPMYFEQWLRFLWIWYKKTKGDIVLTDRWPGYNQNLYKTKKNRILFNVLYTFFPQPNRFVFLSAGPQVIHARKPEMTVDQIEVMQNKMRTLLKGKRYLEVDTSNYDVSMNKVLKYLIYNGHDTCDYGEVLQQKRPTIIEFSGIYASGKTTTAKMLVKELRNRGYEVKDNDDLWKFTQTQSKIRRWFRYGRNMSVWRFMLSSLMYDFSAKNQTQIPERKLRRHLWGPMRDAIDRESFIKNNPSADFVIFDEGSLYVTMDILWKYSFPLSKIKFYLDRINYLQNVHVFIFEPNPDLSKVRTKERNSTSLIDKESDEIREQAICELLPYCEYTNQYAEKYLAATVLVPEEDMEHRVQGILKTLHQS